MTKNSKQKLLFTAIFLSMLMISAAYATQIPNARAAEPTVQERGLTALNDVVGLDLTKYAITSKDFAPDSYFAILPQAKVDYTLESAESKLKLLCTFTDGTLHIINVREREGTPCMTKSATNVLEMAKDFLSNYQRYSGVSFYLGLKSMLNDIDASKNLTMISGNVKLEVTTSGGYTTFRWTYTYNGVDCVDKCVALSYANGFLRYFVDTWNLYPVGSTAINLSEEEAVAIAIESAKTFLWKVGFGDDALEVKDFNVTTAKVTRLSFCSSHHADKPRSDDLLAIYPMWRIGVGLDKFYPGNVYGIYVDIWADTKEIKRVQEVASTLDPELIEPQLFNESVSKSVDIQSFAVEAKSNSMFASLVAAPIVAVTVLGVVPVWLSRKKPWRTRLLPKPRFLRFCGVLFFLLISSSMLLVPVLTVKATAYYGRSTIWGSQWNKSQNENYQQFVTANLLNNYFGYAGYNYKNYRGSQTQKAWILGNMSSEWQNYPRVAVVYFDHGIGDNYTVSHGGDNQWHYHLLDNSYTGRGDNDHCVFDMDVYTNTDDKQPFFAFISTCMSANLTFNCPEGGGLNAYGNAVGMPFAFTHRRVGIDMSSDGYNESDSGAFCYIGFPWGSASLTQYIDYHDVYYYEWVWEFFHSALYNDISVNDALDDASQECFESDFGGTALHNGFTAIWWGCDPGYDSTMVVYGNGNLKLYQPFLTVNADPGLTANVYIDGQYVGTTQCGGYRVSPGSHQIQVSVPNGYEFANFTWTGGSSTNNPVTLDVSSDMTVTAHFEEAWYWLTVHAYDNWQNYVPTWVYIDSGQWEGMAEDSFYVPAGDHAVAVDATVYGEYGEEWWFYLFDGYGLGENPVSVSVHSDMELTAIYWRAAK